MIFVLANPRYQKQPKDTYRISMNNYIKGEQKLSLPMCGWMHLNPCLSSMKN